MKRLGIAENHCSFGNRKTGQSSASTRDDQGTVSTPQQALGEWGGSTGHTQTPGYRALGHYTADRTTGHRGIGSGTRGKYHGISALIMFLIQLVISCKPVPKEKGKQPAAQICLRLSLLQREDLERLSVDIYMQYRALPIRERQRMLLFHMQRVPTSHAAVNKISSFGFSSLVYHRIGQNAFLLFPAFPMSIVEV